MQVLMIAGRVGNVKEVKEVGDGHVLNFSLAVDNGKDKSGEKRDPTWYDCALWGKRAESLAPYIEKGMALALQGRPSARCHEDKAYLGLTVNELTFMSSAGEKKQRSDDDYTGGATTSGAKETYDLNDDIPF